MAKDRSDLESDGLYKIIERLVGISDVGAGEFGIELLRISEFYIETNGIQGVQIHSVHIFHEDLRGVATLDVSIEGLGIAHVNGIVVIISSVTNDGFVIHPVGLVVLQNLQNLEAIIFVKPHIAGGNGEQQQGNQAQFVRCFHVKD